MNEASAGASEPLAPPGNAAGAPAHGLAAMTRLEQLPLLQLHTLAGGQSSYERNTHGPSRGNADWNNFLDVRGGEKVMLDQRGPGVVYRIWATGFDPATDWLRVYFDDEPAPRIDILLSDLFSGTRAPFLAPLVADATMSSGGFTCYLPLPYQRSIRITTNMSRYYNIGFHTFGPGTQVTTWTGTEDSTAARSAWVDAGVDPKDPDGEAVTAGVVHLRPGSVQTIFDRAGPRSISSMRITIPGVIPARSVTDAGRAHRGHCRFTVAISPDNSGVVLVRRMDHGVSDQRALVRVDGVVVGEWADPGSDGAYRWRDSSFGIPPTFTAGKSTLTVRIDFVSSGFDWNEFCYRVYSAVNGAAVLTDTLDVADAPSESAHSYALGGQTWTGTRSFVYPAQRIDHGRAHRESSRFTLTIRPDNSGVVLTRRMDHGVADQRATVRIDGAHAGVWEDPGSDPVHRWRDSWFEIPAALTAGKSAITVDVEFVSGALDWNEFSYRAYSTVGDIAVKTDTLDVADAASEESHGYVISGQTWTGRLLAGYDTADLLNSTHLRMYWDGEAIPSVDAPLGSFFGMGRFGAYATRALVVGIDDADRLYVQLPMPFRRRARIELVSTRTIPTAGVGYEIRHTPRSGGFGGVGYLRTRLSATTPTVVGQDIPILDVTGSGSFIGVTASYAGSTTRSYLEGDERIHVDDSGSPAFYGTGTEDFFNGGWYFEHGPYTQPMSGNTAHVVDGGADRVAAYRFFLQDAVPFRRRIRVSIEHGGHNETTTDAWMLAYYYQQPRTRLVLSDTLDVGNSASEAAHGYRISGQRWTGSRTYQYEGGADRVDVVDSGRAHRGTSRFVMSIDPANDGVVLRRRFDQTIRNQRADVHVGGRLVGPWYVAGGNAFSQWRDTDFLIPPSATTGKQRITVQIRFVSSALDWNEFTYWAYSLLP